MDVTTAEREWLYRINNKPVRTEEQRQPVIEVTPHIGRNIPAEKKGKGFSHVAGMNELKEFVTDGFINVLRNKECAAAYGVRPPSMLLYGPAGCGKTFFAEKVGEEVGIHFMKVVPDDIACMWIHGTQQKIGELFRKAEKNGPTLVFLDEFDAMVPCRSSNEANQYLNGEVNEFLCMLNNAADRGVYVMAATNHPERIDKAVLRTGRIDELIYVDMPDKESRKSLFRLELSRLPFDESIDFARLADLTQGYNCSDISYIVKSASRRIFNASIREPGQYYKKISQDLLEETIAGKSPSVSGRDLREFERIRGELSPKDRGCRRAAIGFR